MVRKAEEARMQMEQLGLFKKVRVYIDTAKGEKLTYCDRHKTCVKKWILTASVNICWNTTDLSMDCIF